MEVERNSPERSSKALVLKSTSTYFRYSLFGLTISPEGKDPWGRQTWGVVWSASFIPNRGTSSRAWGIEVISESDLRIAFRLPIGASRNASFSARSDYAS